MVGRPAGRSRPHSLIALTAYMLSNTYTCPFNFHSSPSTAAATAVMADLLQSVLSWLMWYLRPLVKGFLRLTTRLCELQRLCYGEKAGAPRTCAVGRSTKVLLIFESELTFFLF